MSPRGNGYKGLKFRGNAYCYVPGLDLTLIEVCTVKSFYILLKICPSVSTLLDKIFSGTHRGEISYRGARLMARRTALSHISQSVFKKPKGI